MSFTGINALLSSYNLLFYFFFFLFFLINLFFIRCLSSGVIIFLLLLCVYYLLFVFVIVVSGGKRKYSVCVCVCVCVCMCVWQRYLHNRLFLYTWLSSQSHPAFPPLPSRSHSLYWPGGTQTQLVILPFARQSIRFQLSTVTHKAWYW